MLSYVEGSVSGLREERVARKRVTCAKTQSDVQRPMRHSVSCSAGENTEGTDHEVHG